MLVISRMNETEIPITHEKKVWKEYIMKPTADSVIWTTNKEEALKFGEQNVNWAKSLAKTYHGECEKL